MNQYLVARYGDPCRQCGFVWAVDTGTARELVEGAASRLDVLRRAPTAASTPSPGSWGAAGYVAHLADTIRVWAERVAAASIDSNAVIVPYDERALGEVMGYDSGSIEGSLWALDRAIEGWKAARSLGAPGARLDHPEQGPLTVEGAQTILAHEIHHHSMDIWRTTSTVPRGSCRSPSLTIGPTSTVFSLAREDPHAPEVAALLHAHFLFNRAVTPQEHVHALEVEALSGPAIDLFAARVDGDPVAVGAFKRLSVDHGELKSMHTDPRWRGRGAGTAVVRYLLQHAASLGCTRVSLETGSMPAFEPARRLYARLGFVPCPPFGDYTENPYSVCMTKAGGSAG